MQKLFMVMVGLFLAAGVAPPAAMADACKAGNYSAIAGTTCTIGSLQFSFLNNNNLVGSNSVLNLGTLTYTYSAIYDNSSLDFTPVRNGFSLTFLGSPQSLSPTASPNLIAEDNATIFFSVTDRSGNFIGESVSGSPFSVSSTDPSTSWSLDVYSGSVYCTACSSAIIAGTGVSQTNGTLSVVNVQNDLVNVQNGLPGAPFSSGTGYADVFNLGSGFGGPDLGWQGGPTTFTFSTVPAPEPTAALLLVFGLASLGIWKIRAGFGGNGVPSDGLRPKHLSVLRWDGRLTSNHNNSPSR
jgi:hypothetical protein